MLSGRRAADDSRTSRQGRTELSIWKLLPAKVHGVADYGSGFALVAVALIFGFSETAVGTGFVLGAVLIVISLLTDYPLGLIKVIPFVVHSAGDYLGAAALIAAPFVLGFNDSDTRAAASYIVMGVALVAVSLITDYGDTTRRSIAD